MSELEAELEFQIRAYKLPAATREHRFDPVRRWRFDFCWIPQKIALEIEGGIWIRGGHNRGKGFISDCDKYNKATLDGWRVFRVTTNHVRSGEAINLLQAALR